MKHLSLLQLFTAHLQSALRTAFSFAAEFGHERVTSAHLLYGLAAEKGSLSSELLTKADFPVDLLKQELVRQHYTPFLPDRNFEPEMHEQVVTILTKSIRTAQLHEHPYVGTEHVLACLINLMDEELKQLFNIWHVDSGELQRQLLVVLKSTSKFPDLADTLRELQSSHEESLEDVSAEFPVLETLAKELTDPSTAKHLSPLIGREKELEQMQQILVRRFKNNPLLVGKPGVGKTALVEGLAKAILQGTSAPALTDKRLFSLELGNLVAGTMYRGEFEQRMKMLVDELREHPDTLLFIDEIHTLVGAGSTGQALDAANILKPALARGDIRCIGATTWDEFQKHLAKDQALARRFQVVFVDEPNKEQTRKILEGISKEFERHHAVTIQDESLDTALELSERYLTHTAWPDKAIDLLDDASAHLRLKMKQDPLAQKKKRLKSKMQKLQKEKSRHLGMDQYAKAIEIHQQLTNLNAQLEKLIKKPQKKQRLLTKHVHEAVARRTGISTDRLDKSASSLSEHLQAALSREIVGQDEALRRLTSTLQRGYSPLKDPHKPLGAFLLSGPSGVGKTQTAKVLARELFGSEQSLIRLDMSEFGERHSISKLIGAPAGYVGYQDSGMLTNAVQKRPLSIVLFDEIEKAHPDIFNLLLQILDEGKLTDNSGMVTDFRQTLILLTSNLGLDELNNPLGFEAPAGNDQARIKEAMGAAVRKFLRPELMNRLDEVVYFSALGNAERKAIIKKRIQELNDRLKPGLTLQLHPSAVDALLSHYREEQGARSLLMAIKDQIEIPLTGQLSSFETGTALKLAYKDGKIAFEQR